MEAVRGHDGTWGSRDRPDDRGPRAHGNARQHPDPATSTTAQRRRRIEGSHNEVLFLMASAGRLSKKPEALRRVGERGPTITITRVGMAATPRPLLQATTHNGAPLSDDRPLAQGHRAKGDFATSITQQSHIAPTFLDAAQTPCPTRGWRKTDAVDGVACAFLTTPKPDQHPGKIRDVRHRSNL